MSGHKIVVKQAFGINRNTKNCLSFSEDHHLAYACGHQVVIINTETKEQKFIAGTNTYQHQSKGISAILCSIGRKLIAVAEKCEPTAIVTFYDTVHLKKKKVLTYNELGSTEIKCLAFSDDGRFLLTQGCGPEWNLVMWNVEKSVKVLCSTKVSLSDDAPVHQVSFCPSDPNVVLVLGKGILRIFRYVEGQFRPITLAARNYTSNFISHCWLPEDILILGSEHGEVTLIENLEYRGVVYPSASDAVDDPTPVTCITGTARGFVVGTYGSDLKIFERNEEIKEKYQLEDTIRIPGQRGDISAFALGPDENLAISTDKNQLLTVPLTNLNVKEGTPNFENILSSFHMPNSKGEAAITGMDVAVWKQMVVTCGKDRTVRVWNPTEKKAELSMQFDEDPLSISVHPSGIYIAVAFTDKIRFLSLLLDEIFLVREIVARQCSLVKFSVGGHLLAAALGSNLQVFNTYTGAPVATLRGHNNKIKNLIWSCYDSKMMTIGSEGVVYHWELFPVARLHEHYPGTVPIASGTASKDTSKVYVATYDRLLKELPFLSGQVAAEMQANGAASAGAGAGMTSLSTHGTDVSGVVKPSKNVELDYHIGPMIYDDSKKLLMVSSVEDSVGAIMVGQASPSIPNTFEYNILHNTAITTMVQSNDGTVIYTGDANGCLLVSEFENSSFSVGKNQIGKIREGPMAFEFVEEVMIHKSNLESRRDQIRQLTHRVDELMENNEHQLRLKELDHKDRMKEIERKFTTQLNSEKVKYQELHTEKLSVESEFQRKVKVLENKHVDELRAIEMKYKTKQASEALRHKTLMEETEDAHKRWNAENQTLVESHQKYLHEITIEYEDKLASEQRLQKKIAMEKEELTVNFSGAKNDTEQFGDSEVAEMKIRYDAKLKKEEDEGIELMAQHALMKKNLQMLSKDSSLQKDEIKRLRDKETRLYETIHSLEKDIQSHKKEIREREETITDKEKRIFDLKKKNQELEKFRFVLDYKIKELKLQIAPRENEIATMRKQIEEMDIELEQYNKSNLSLNLMIDELKLKLEGVRNEMKCQEDRYAANLRLMDKFKREIQEVWSTRSTLPKFKGGVVQVYQTYVQDESPAPGANHNKADADDPQQVYNRDREQMERNLDSLRRTVRAEAQAHKRDLGKMMRESVLLTNELNLLRKNARSLQLQKKAVEQAGNIGPNSDLTELMELLHLQVKKPSKSSSGKGGVTQQMSGDDILMMGGGNSPVPGAPAEMGSLTAVMPPRAKSRTGPPPSRSAALRTASADGKSTGGARSAAVSRQDQWEAWREIQMQYDHMKQLEDQLTELCHAVNIDPNMLIQGIDSNLMLGV